MIILLGAALNKAEIPKKPETDWAYLKRTIGPGTWIYEILDNDKPITTWDKLQIQLKTITQIKL